MTIGLYTFTRTKHQNNKIKHKYLRQVPCKWRDLYDGNINKYSTPKRGYCTFPGWYRRHDIRIQNLEECKYPDNYLLYN